MQNITVYTFTNLTIGEEYYYKFIVRRNEFSRGSCNMIEEILNEILKTSIWMSGDHIIGKPHCTLFPTVEMYCSNIKLISNEDELSYCLNNMKF
jgi:hypothetical protein